MSGRSTYRADDRAPTQAERQPAACVERRRRYLLDTRTWPDDLEVLLELIDDPTPASWYRTEYDAGRLDLLAVIEPAAIDPLCYILTRPEVDDFVLVAAVSRRPDHCLTAAVLPLLEERAKGHGCNAVRLHTRRWGLAAIAGEVGYQIAEIVLRKGLA